MNNNISSKWIDQLALWICATFCILWFAILNYKFQHFGYSDWDLAISDQIMRNICHGSSFSSIIGHYFLADHAHYIAYLIAPIYLIFQHPLTLIFLKIFSLAAGAFVLYKLANQSIAKPAALSIMLLYLFHPANLFMLFYEFQFENLAIVFIFLLFYFFLNKRLPAFLITAFVLMLIKENMALIVGMFGLYGLWQRRENRFGWAIVPLSLAAVFFLTNMLVIIPLVRKSLPSAPSVYWHLYSHASHKAGLFSNLWDFQNLIYLRDIFGSFLLFALVSWQTLLLGIPILLQNLLSKAWQMHTIYFHYSATFLPFIAVACVNSVHFLQTRLSKLSYKLLWVLTFFIFLFNIYHFVPMWQEEIAGWKHRSLEIREHMIQQIPKEAGVVASFEFLSHLTDHTDLYALYNVSRNFNYFTGQHPFVLPNKVGYALINSEDPWFLPAVNKASINKNLTNFLSSGQWIILEQQGSITLYQKKDNK